MLRAWSFLVIFVILPAPIFGSEAETQLLEAAREGDVNRLHRLLDAGADVNGTDSDGLTALMYAVWYEHTEAARLLLDKGADIQRRDVYNQTALVYGVENGDERIVRILLDAGANPNDGNFKGEPLLITALLGRSREAAVALIDAGADVKAETPGGGISPIMTAAMAGFTDVVEILIKKGVDIGGKEGNRPTALMYAAGSGHAATVELLLASGADVKTKDRDGATALMKAAQKGYSKVVSILIAAGAEIDGKDGSGKTALLEAAEGGHTETVLRLIRAGADPNSKDRDGRIAFLAAAYNGRAGVVKFLLEAGSDIESRDKQQKTALILTAHNRSTKTIEILLAAGAKVNARDKSGNSALSEAAADGNAGVVKLLLSGGADVNFQDNQKRTALMRAAERGEGAVVKLLLDAGADSKARDSRGETAFLHALSRGYPGIAALLGTSGTDPTVLKQKLLEVVGREGDALPDIVKVLLDAGVDVETRSRALMIAAERGHGDVVRLLLEAGADTGMKDRNGQTALALAALKGHVEVVGILKKAGARTGSSLDSELKKPVILRDSQKLRALIEVGVDVNVKDMEGATPLIRAFNGWYVDSASAPEIVRILLSAGADPNIKDNKGQTALLYALMEKQSELAESLLEAGADPMIKDNEGQTALFYALRESPTELVLKMLKAVGDPNVKDKSGETALFYALMYKRIDLVPVLLEAGAEINYKDRSGDTPLQMALMSGLPEAVMALIGAGADISSRDRYGLTPLMQATQLGSVELIRLLLAKGADVKAKGNDGGGVLIYAQAGGHSQIVALLREAGAEDQPELLEQVFLNALKDGDFHIIRNLLSTGADANLIDPATGNSALQIFVESGNTEMAGILLRAGADPALADRLRGWPPLTIASVAANEDMVRILLAADADVNQRDRDWGWTALMHAANTGYEKIVKLLLASGADAGVKDRDWGWTALTLAAKSGQVEVLKILLEAGGDVNVPDRRGWTPLMWAVYRNDLQTAELLIKHNAETDKQDLSGRTAHSIAERLGHGDMVLLIEKTGRKDAARSSGEGSVGLSMVIQNSHPAATAVAFSPDGKYLASGGTDRTVKLWSTDGRLIRTIKGHTDLITSVAFSPDGDSLVSGSLDGTVRIWSLYGEAVRELSVPSNKVYGLVFHPDGKHILIASRARSRGYRADTVTLWRIEGQMVRSFEGHFREGRSVAVSPDGSLVASSGDDNTIRLWRMNGDPVIEIEGLSPTVTSVTISPDGSLVAGAGSDGKIAVWDSNGKPVRSIDAHSGSIEDILFSTDGRYIISAGSHQGRGAIMVWDMADEQVRIIQDDSSLVYAIDLDEDGRIAGACRGSRASLKLWSTDGRVLKRLRSEERIIESKVSFDPVGRYIVSSSSGETSKKSTIRIWGDDGRLMRHFAMDAEIVRSIAIDRSGNTIAAGGSDGRLRILDKNGRLIQVLEGHSDDVTHAFIDQEGKLLASGDWSGRVLIRNLRGQKIAELKGHIRTWSLSSLASNHLAIVTDIRRSEYGKLVLWDIDLSSIEGLVDSDRIWVVVFNQEKEEATVIATISGREEGAVQMWSLKARPVRIIEDRTDYWRDVFISPDGKYIAGISRRYPNLVRLWDLVGRPLKTLEMPAGAISAISFSPDGKSLAGGSFDGRISKWNIESSDHMSLLGIGDEWIIYSPDGYFDSSRRGGELVSMVRGLSAFGPDQFALRYNRPDLVLKRLDFPRDETIRHFYLQYIKRLVKFRILPNRIRKPVFEEAILSALSNREDRQFLLSIYQSQDEYYDPVKEPSLRDRYRLFSLSPFLEYVERDLGREMHVPEAEFLEVRQQGKFVDLDFRLTDTRFELLSYNVYMNDVPLFGSSGKPISGSKLILSERVELAAGINKIEVGCVNDRLAESFREQRFAEYNGSAKPDLYFVGFGVSKYKNPDLNLVYPHKDVKDLRSLFSGMKGYFDSIYAYDFVDEKCTTSSIRKVKKLLADASVDDTVVLFISGHGMHSRDPEAVYYFLIHEADIDNLGQTAADFDLIEDILDGVKPRYKLFLMDTCESGELDEELAQVYLKDAEEMGLRARTPKGFSVPAKGVSTGPRRAYLMERDRYIYNDVFRRTGAIVFSSSRGGEYSYEPDSYEEEENGFFTGAIIKSIKDNRADRDKDGFVTTDEMREYVSRAVKERTNGLQNPTVDRDNLYLKFGFPSAD